ncbi:MAG: hypothetical protein ACOH10_05055 [Rhodoglobus sp.]
MKTRAAVSPGTASFRTWVRRWAVAIVLVILGVAVVISNVSRHDESFSPLDEWVYYDYVQKFPTQGFVHMGEEIGSPALEAMACDGDSFGPRGEPCTGPDGIYDEPELYPQQGLTSADAYTPAYFGITWVSAQVVSVFTGADLLTNARYTGVLWIAFGLIMFVLLLREFRVPAVLQLGLGMIAISQISSYYAFTYISTDAPALAMGSAVAFFGARFAKSGRGGWWLVGASVVAIVFKFVLIFMVGLVAIALMIQAVVTLRRGQPWRGGPKSPGRLIAFALMAAAGALAAQVAWLVIRSAAAVGPSPDQGLSAQISPFAAFRSLFTFLIPSPASAESSAVQFILYPISVLVIVGVIGWFVTQKGWGVERTWSIATLMSATVFAPLLLIALQLMLGTTAPVEQRYALGVMPMFFVAAAIIIRNSFAQWLVLAYGVALVGLTIIGVVPR